MSRNGSSLAYEIIAQYFPLKLYPARIDFACSQEEFWPLNCKSRLSLNDFFNKLIKKHYVEKGSNIENYIHSSIQNIQEINIKYIKKKFLEKASLYKKLFVQRLLTVY